MEQVNRSAAWQALEQHATQLQKKPIVQLFQDDPQRFEHFSAHCGELWLDFSKNLVTTETIHLLLNLAAEQQLEWWREQMFSGAAINHTEKRAVLHTALRAGEPALTDEQKLVQQELAHLAKLVRAVRSGDWRGYRGDAIQDIVHIGIGGSDLGPAMVVKALQGYQDKLKIHFVSNVDPKNLAEVLQQVKPTTTLFVVASKTFTTQETLTNAKAAKEWWLNQVAAPDHPQLSAHFIGVTAHPERAQQFGIAPDNIFPFWDWVGGRFSLWSSIGISIALAVGMEHFLDLLAGAHAMDEHFKNAPLAQNLPVLLALLGIWQRNFLNCASLAIIPYHHHLALFPAYLQQLEMESNGKRVNRNGEVVNYATAPIVWGGIGTNSQHSFHQLLMQGTTPVAIDFIVTTQAENPADKLLYANCLAQSRALMVGRNRETLLQKNLAEELIPHKEIPGNVAHNLIFMDRLTPYNLGALIALYEHKVFVQGVIWQINSFDQWGVELGKELATQLLPYLDGASIDTTIDSSTRNLIMRFTKINIRE